MKTAAPRMKRHTRRRNRRAPAASRALDAYAVIAYDCAGLQDEDDFLEAEGGSPALKRVPGDLHLALDWAAAGVSVLLQSLPYPFRDVLLYGNNNRPAHRSPAADKRMPVRWP